MLANAIERALKVRKQPSFDREPRRIDKGKLKVSGKLKKLRDSEPYPEAFGEAVVSAWFQETPACELQFFPNQACSLTGGRASDPPRRDPIIGNLLNK